MNPERAYWIFSPAGGQGARFAGIPADGIVSLRAGWNLAGTVAGVGALPDEPLAAWQWMAKAQEYRQLNPGETLRTYAGYWLYLIEAGDLGF